MLPCFTLALGNADSNSHSFGWELLPRLKNPAPDRWPPSGALPQGNYLSLQVATESDHLALKVWRNDVAKGDHHHYRWSRAQGGARYLQHLEKSAAGTYRPVGGTALMI